MTTRHVEYATQSGLTISARIAEVDHPRTTILALHGGGLHSGYFDGQTTSDVSLLELGRTLGHTVIAVDRPGYRGGANKVTDEQTTLSGQAALLWEFLDATVAETSPIALMGHSFGSMVAVTMAAEASGRPLCGIEISGVGSHYSEALQTDPDRAASRRTHWGHEYFYPEGTFDPGVRPHAVIPGIETGEALDWPDRVAHTASRVVVPVSITVAELEVNWSNTPEQFAGLFTAAPRVVVQEQIDSGHNMSLGYTARPYHLRSIAFFEECVLHERMSAVARSAQ